MALEFERNDGTVVRSGPREVEVTNEGWLTVTWEGESICVRRFSILFEGNEPLLVDDIEVIGISLDM